MENEKVKLLEMFPCCGGLSGLCGGLDKAEVLDVRINRERLYMDVKASFARAPAPAEKREIENCIAREFGMGVVALHAESAHAAPKPAAPEKKKPAKKQPAEVSGDVLFGKMINGRPVSMSEINRESGAVIVRGEVFAVESREVGKSGSAVLQFDMTDNTGSMRVTKFFRAKTDKSIIEKIKKGLYVAVEGMVVFDRYVEDIVIDPKNIVLSKKPVRKDDAGGDKRVELHMHTRYSALDALADPGAVVARAAAWGHKAVAITDHGVAQAFP